MRGFYESKALDEVIDGTDLSGCLLHYRDTELLHHYKPVQQRLIVMHYHAVLASRHLKLSPPQHLPNVIIRTR